MIEQLEADNADFQRQLKLMTTSANFLDQEFIKAQADNAALREALRACAWWEEGSIAKARTLLGEKP